MSFAISAQSSVQVPGGPSFATLKKNVAGYVQGANLTNVLTDAGAAINAAVDHFNTRNWHWLNKQETLTLVADTRTVTVAANFKRPRKLERLDTNSKTVDDYGYQIPKVFEDTGWDDTESGQPQYYTVRNAVDDRLLTFNVPPSTAFITSWPTARLTYFARANHFSDDGNTLGSLEIPSEARNFLIWYARWELAAMRGTPTQINTANDAWMRAWVALMKDDNNLQTDWQSRRDYR